MARLEARSWPSGFSNTMRVLAVFRPLAASCSQTVVNRLGAVDKYITTLSVSRSAKRWAKAGYAVILGSRDAAKAADAAKELPGASGLSNVDAAKAGDIVVIAVPYSNHKAILAEIKDAVQGKVVVDTTVPLVPPKVGTV